jgi:hypothetical protein
MHLTYSSPNPDKMVKRVKKFDLRKMRRNDLNKFLGARKKNDPW